MKIATWNIKQAIAPKKPLPELWQWMDSDINPDIIVLTEAKVPKEGVPFGWNAVWKDDGIGPNRRWGTVIAARTGFDLIDISEGASGRGGFSVSHTWPGTVTIVDVMRSGKYVATVVGIYGITLDLEGNSIGSGEVSVPTILDDLKKFFGSKRSKNLVIVGDFNLTPNRMPDFLFNRFVDVVEETFGERELVGCSGCTSNKSPCGHMWTHKNGNKPGARVQHLDYIFVSKKIARNIVEVKGGVADFPDAWDVSDHAPVMLEIEV